MFCAPSANTLTDMELFDNTFAFLTLQICQHVRIKSVLQAIYCLVLGGLAACLVLSLSPSLPHDFDFISLTLPPLFLFFLFSKMRERGESLSLPRHSRPSPLPPLQYYPLSSLLLPIASLKGKKERTEKRNEEKRRKERERD